jgi:nitrogen regulatory protein PII
MKHVMAVIRPFRLGQTGNGKTFVLDRQSAVHIGAGETGAAAIREPAPSLLRTGVAR